MKSTSRSLVFPGTATSQELLEDLDHFRSRPVVHYISEHEDTCIFHWLRGEEVMTFAKKNAKVRN
jgi:hypothetical protein